ncbi:MAG: hypothetical protein H0V17_04640 [Deltaproteobacteria bacterium]|nr:hypothetical protein [Deltaproteobacteria bacterium]
MPTTSFSRNVRNPATVAVSLFVLLFALLGSVLAEGRGRGPQRQPTPQGPVRHETKFRQVPGASLEIRATTYDGSTNGTLTVEIRNPAKTAQKFAATGLYFVPEGDPDQAPQRLGAVGPMQITRGDGKEKTELVIAAGATVEVKLDVFCIDSHRSSPSPQNVFNVGVSRLPKELAATIEGRADNAVRAKRASGAAARPAAKSEIQSEVWKSRDAKWIKLDGEGQQEATK